MRAAGKSEQNQKGGKGKKYLRTITSIPSHSPLQKPKNPLDTRSLPPHPNRHPLFQKRLRPLRFVLRPTQPPKDLRLHSSASSSPSSLPHRTASMHAATASGAIAAIVSASAPPAPSASPPAPPHPPAQSAAPPPLQSSRPSAIILNASAAPPAAAAAASRRTPEPTPASPPAAPVSPSRSPAASCKPSPARTRPPAQTH